MGLGADAGTVYSSIRIRLNQLDNDLKGVYARLNQLETKLENTVEKPTKKITGSFNAMSIAGVAAFVGVGNAMRKSVSQFADFEQSMANVASVAGASADEMEDLGDAAKNAGETTRYSASQASEALYYLASAGYDANQSIGALDGVLKLAQATGSDLASTSATMAATLSQYSLEVTESGRVTNVFAAAISSSQASMDKLSTGLRQVGPVAGSLGISLEETVANLDALYNKGYQGEQAGTALRSILLDLVDPASEVNKKLQEQGVSFDKVNPRVVGLTGAFENMAGAGVDLTKVFNKVSAAQAIALIQTAESSEKNLRDLEKQITNTNKAAESMETQNNSLRYSQDILKSTQEALAISMTDTFSPAIRGVLDSLSKAFVFLSKLPDSLKALVGVTGAVSVGLGGVASVAAALGVSLAPLLPVLLPIAAGIAAIGTTAVIATKSINEHKKAMAELSDVAEVTVGQYKDIEQEISFMGLANDLQSTEDRVTNIARAFGTTKSQVIEVGLASEIVSDEYKDQLRILKEQKEEQLRINQEKAKQIEQDETITDSWLLKLDYAKKMAAEQERQEREEQRRNEKEQERIQGIIDARNAANDQYQKQVTAANALVKLGAITQEEARSRELDATQNLIESLVELGYTEEANGKVGFAMLTDALNRRKELIVEIEKEDALYEKLFSRIEEISELEADARAQAIEDYEQEIVQSDLAIAKKNALLEKLYEIRDAQEDINELNIDFQKHAETGYKSVLSGLENVGKALYEGTSGTKAFAKATLEAFAAILRALGAELAAYAAKAFILTVLGHPTAGAGIGIATAGSAGAYLSAGLVSGYAGSFENGGIVPGTSYRGDNLYAAVNSGEYIMTRGQQIELSEALARVTDAVSTMNNSQEIKLVVSGKTLAKVVTRQQRANKV